MLSDSCPELLDKGNHRFQYKEVEYGDRAQKYYSSIEWVLRDDIVHLAKLVTNVKIDLDDYVSDDSIQQTYRC